MGFGLVVAWTEASMMAGRIIQLDLGYCQGSNFCLGC